MIAATVHHCTSQPNIRIQNHHQNLRATWNTPEWRKESAAYKARHPAKCSRCGTEGMIIPGHTDEDYRDMPTYIQKVRDDQVQSLCQRCNRNEAKGKHPCPSCIEKHAADPKHRINYVTRDQEVCRQCEPGYNPETSKFRHEQRNRIKNARNRVNYRKYHPGKTVVNGVWVYVKPVPVGCPSAVAKGCKAA
jgi:hypothetical protein